MIGIGLLLGWGAACRVSRIRNYTQCFVEWWLCSFLPLVGMGSLIGFRIVHFRLPVAGLVIGDWDEPESLILAQSERWRHA